ncbi:MAG: ion transporter [Chloroflexi bacterium]|nr:ion transporter [Chloroflexota bacterium]MYD46888.1 ion transporter [Chloroflexota bacterium]
MNPTESSQHSQPPRLRRRVYALMEPSVAPGLRIGGPVRADPAFMVEFALVSIIVVNSTALVLWTVPHLASSYGAWFHLIEYCTVGIFLLEYALRFWTAPESASDPEAAGWRRRWRYLVTPHALVDAVALVPSGVAVVILLSGVGGPSLSFLLTVRLLTRTAKLARYFSAARRLALAVRQKSGHLLTAVVALIVALVMAATLMYFAETEAQPDIFSSIPASMWWSVVTLTTVGYGDTVPITPIGRALAAVIAVLGIGLFALPAGIISAGLLEVDAAEDTAVRYDAGHPQNGDVCPHCGQPMPDKTDGD